MTVRKQHQENWLRVRYFSSGQFWPFCPELHIVSYAKNLHWVQKSDLWRKSLAQTGTECQWQQRADSLWVRLVKRPVDTNRGPQPGCALVISKAVQDGAQRCSHQVGRAKWHNGTHVLDWNTVVIGWLHSQAGQDFFGIVEAFLIPVRLEAKNYELRPTSGSAKHWHSRVLERWSPFTPCVWYGTKTVKCLRRTHEGASSIRNTR